MEVHDLVSTAIIVSLRRAHDLADAITARGGIGAISDGARRLVRLARRRRRSLVVTAIVAGAARRRAADRCVDARSSGRSRSDVVEHFGDVRDQREVTFPGHVVRRASGRRSTSASVCASGTSVSAVPCQQCTGTVISLERHVPRPRASSA